MTNLYWFDLENPILQFHINVHTDTCSILIYVQTYEHHLINRIINNIIKYADQINSYKRHSLEVQDSERVKVALQTICEELPQDHINMAVANFTRLLAACVAASGGHFDHVQ